MSVDGVFGLVVFVAALAGAFDKMATAKPTRNSEENLIAMSSATPP
jgi:hypothetical protein